MGYFSGFMADIPTEPSSTSIKKERPMRPHVLREIKPLMEELIKEIFFFTS